MLNSPHLHRCLLKASLFPLRRSGPAIRCLRTTPREGWTVLRLRHVIPLHGTELWIAPLCGTELWIAPLPDSSASHSLRAKQGHAVTTTPCRSSSASEYEGADGFCHQET